jgi:hypothetical protein
MAKKKSEMSEEEWKAANVKPEIPLDVQQSILGVRPESAEVGEKEEAAEKEA